MRSPALRAQSARLGIEVECAVDAGTTPVSPQLGWDPQCIAEEAIANVARHGGATRVSVEGGPDAVGRCAVAALLAAVAFMALV
ncbi:MAG: hypothetical protein AAGU73_04405 [Actinomycetota bacterium]